MVLMVFLSFSQEDVNPIRLTLHKLTTIKKKFESQEILMGSFIISQEILAHPPAKHSHTQVCLCGSIRYRLTNDSGEVRM